MIEKYFEKGVRLKWTKPRDNTGTNFDGSIVQSRGASTPMVYDGMDDKIIPLRNITTLNLFTKNMPIRYDWLDYAPFCTAVKKVSGRDILTGYMSGCRLVYYTEGGETKAAHVGTSDGADAAVLDARNKKVKNTFASAMPKNAKGFNPFGAWTDTEIQPLANTDRGNRTPNIFGLITTSGRFYSLLMFSISNKQGEWAVGGIKPVPAVPYDKLSKFLSA